MNEFLDISAEVRDALERGAAVVALETTILSHGMPYPQNVQTATAVEGIVRECGAVPATIAVIGGRIRIGLTAQELEYFGSARGILKLSRADLAYALASGADGATTVSATMLCAHLARIEIFATGGIGGVHRGAEQTMDVSADLEELGQTPVAVVCSGAKALLDLPKTLEVLETLGVPVAGYCTNELPAFWSRTSGLPLSLRFDSVDEIARFLRVKESLKLRGGVVIANPIPERDEIPAAEMAGYIEAAIVQAEEARITGKAVTPWLLDRVLRITGGRSLQANVALVKNNARLAAQIAGTLVRGGRTNERKK
jgi:pseudouridine-5'-phosphate glycosidase